MLPIRRLQRGACRDKSDEFPGLVRLRYRRRGDGTSELATRKPTDEEVHLIGNQRDLLGTDGRQMYMRVPAKQGSQLRRIGATDNCVVCGMPALPGVTAFAHIDMRDLHLSPCNDPTRVFRLCWHHHHGCYDQGYIATIELLSLSLAIFGAAEDTVQRYQPRMPLVVSAAEPS